MARRRAYRRFRGMRIRVRLLLRRLDRQTPNWMRWLTPWGTSLVIHGLLILILALLFVSGRSESRPQTLTSEFAQLRDDLTSVSEDEMPGDPFTTLTSPEPPSLTFEQTAEITNTPELPPDVLLGQELAASAPLAPTVELGPRVGGFDVPIRELPSLTSPFEGRKGPNRAKLVRAEGGTVQSEEAVERGLDWIQRHQRPDGGWSLDTSGQCARPGCPPRDAMQSDSAATGLALLPLLGSGADHVTPGRYQDVVDRGLKWLIANQQPDGDLFTGGGGNAHMYSHAIATLALCEAYGITRDQMLRTSSEKAFQFIILSQNVQDGGWRYHPGQPGDTSVLGWQVFALRSGHLAGLEIPPRTVLGINNYLNAAATDPIGATYAYQPGGNPSPVMTAESLIARQILGWPPQTPALIQGADQVAADMIQARERNIYYWYYGTQLLHNLKGLSWQVWNPKVRDGLVNLQIKRPGCDRGSWDPILPVADRWGRSAGRLYTTSLSILTLEVYYRYLPLYRTTESAPIEGAPPATER